LSELRLRPWRLVFSLRFRFFFWRVESLAYVLGFSWCWHTAIKADPFAVTSYEVPIAEFALDVSIIDRRYEGVELGRNVLIA
jgi:hypothetical protein